MFLVLAKTDAALEVLHVISREEVLPTHAGQKV